MEGDENSKIKEKFPHKPTAVVQNGVHTGHDENTAR